MRPRELTLRQDEIKRLEEAERETREAVELRRMQAVRMYGSGQVQGLIQDVTGMARRTVAHWVKAYQAAGVDGLKAGWKGGNNRVLSGPERGQVIQRMQQRVGQDGGRCEGLSIEQVMQVVEQASGKRYASRESYRQLLIEAGFSFQHPESIYRSRPSEAVIADFEAAAEKK